jgi:hypothetical protein
MVVDTRDMSFMKKSVNEEIVESSSVDRRSTWLVEGNKEEIKLRIKPAS